MTGGNNTSEQRAERLRLSRGDAVYGVNVHGFV